MNIKSRKISISTILKVAYLILLATAFFYVKSVLDTDSFKPTEKQIQEKAEKIHEANVKLNVEFNGEVKEYKSRFTTVDTVEDFLKELRDEQGLYYEKDLYTYGAEIASVFGKEAGDGKKWAVLLNDKDITNRISNEYLVNDTTYILKQIAL